MSLSSGPPAGVTFDRLASGGRLSHALAATALFVVAFLASGAVIATGFVVADRVVGAGVGTDSLVDLPITQVALTLATLGAAIPVAWGATRLAWRRRFGWLWSVQGRFRWAWAARLILPAIAAMAVFLFVGGVVSATSPSTAVTTPGPAPAPVSMAAFGILLLVPAQAAAEELVFRGWLPQLFGTRVASPVPGVLVASLLFATAHGSGTAWGFANLLAFSGTVAWLTMRTGGIEAAVVLHATQNLIAFTGAIALGQLDVDTNVGDASWQVMAASLVSLPTYAWIVLRLARRHDIPVRTGREADQLQAQGAQPALALAGTDEWGRPVAGPPVARLGLGPEGRSDPWGPPVGHTVRFNGQPAEQDVPVGRPGYESGSDWSGWWPTGTVWGLGGCLVTPDGVAYFPDGHIRTPDGSVFLPDGTIRAASGWTYHPGGWATAPDGTAHRSPH